MTFDELHQAWWRKFLADRQAAYSSQMELLRAAQPWQQPGYSRMANPLLGSSGIPGDQETNPQAAMMGYFMGQQQGSEVDPVLEQYLMGGA